MVLLEAKGLCKTYPGFSLQDVDLTVKKGEIVGFIGRNGAGKSTTLKSLIRMVHPEKGGVQFFGIPFENNEAVIKRRIGFVSGGEQNYLNKKLSAIVKATRPFYDTWDEQAYQKYMKLFCLDENKTPGQLSAGMQVKFALVLALSHRAELLILDEPTSGLDPVSREELLDIFLMLSRQGVGILFSTHITNDLEKCADSIAYIRQGRMVTQESMTSFMDKWRLMRLQDEPSGALADKLIGLKREKRGYSALICATDGDECGLKTERPTLTDIMVHMEGGLEL